MKLSDFLTGVGRPVAFYPGLAKALGSIKQAVFVCQLAYWKDKGNDPDGWIYKSAEEIEAETALTYKEQTKVREDLKALGALEERYARTEHKMYFRINWDVLNNLWEEHLTKSNMPHITKSKVVPYQRSTGSLPKVISLNSNTENTQKNTHNNGGGLSEKELEQANRQVTDMIAHSRKRTYQNRDKFPEPLLPYVDTYVQLTGQEPTKRVCMDWLMTFQEWISEGLQPYDIQAAWSHANRPEGGFLVGRPGALTNTAVALKSKARKTDEARGGYDPFAGLMAVLEDQHENNR